MAKLPKNIYLFEYKTNDGKQYKYQVKKTIKGKKYNKLFDDVKLAEEYILEISSHFGRKSVVEHDLMQKQIMEQWKNPNFKFFFMEYFKWKHPSNFDNKDILKRKYFNAYKSFFKTILNTPITAFNEEKLNLSPQISSRLLDLGFKDVLTKTTKLADLKLHEITYKSVNSYIKARLALGISKITIRKEISILSMFFQEVRYVETIPLKLVEELQNPTKLIDKRLLANAYNVKKVKRIDDENFLKLQECYDKEKDLSFKYVSLLQLFGGFRMNEAIFLTWEMINIDENKIFLARTKTTPRTVYITQELQDLLEEIEPIKENRIGRVVPNQGIYKFSKMMQRFRDKYKFTLTSQQFRKEAISRMIDKVGNSNPLQLAQILGFSNPTQMQADYMEQDTPDLTTIDGVLKNVGHKNMSTTAKHYYGLPKLQKD